MKIVPMREAHIPQIAALERQCFSAPWSELSLQSELQNPLSLWLVAAEDDAVLGYIGSQTVLGESDMMNLAVGEAYRRRGIGRILTQALSEALRAQNAVSLTLEVRASNEAARGLYGSLGFQLVGRRPRYYRQPTEDAELYRKDLTI
ncbi:MAG: ribosomal protein S18-alanine N-acetyltransferase [Oscillospiraceae bacterium]|nr:ribosomal protein S18-alanine N-acetyltransferase [Oscillospiraceae bacterium]